MHTGNEIYTRALADIEQIVRGKQATEQAADRVNNLATVFNLVGNDVRLKILFLLDKEKRLCVCDLADILEMTIPAVSQHLKKLKSHHFVEKINDEIVVKKGLKASFYSSFTFI